MLMPLCSRVYVLMYSPRYQQFQFECCVFTTFDCFACSSLVRLSPAIAAAIRVVCLQTVFSSFGVPHFHLHDKRTTLPPILPPHHKLGDWQTKCLAYSNKCQQRKHQQLQPEWQLKGTQMSMQRTPLDCIDASLLAEWVVGISQPIHAPRHYSYDALVVRQNTCTTMRLKWRRAADCWQLYRHSDRLRWFSSWNAFCFHRPRCCLHTHTHADTGFENKCEFVHAIWKGATIPDNARSECQVYDLMSSIFSDNITQNLYAASKYFSYFSLYLKRQEYGSSNFKLKQNSKNIKRAPIFSPRRIRLKSEWKSHI